MPFSALLDGVRMFLPIKLSTDCVKSCGTQENPTPADVDAHPAGASAAGVQDLVGNVWQYVTQQPHYTTQC